MQCEIRKSCNLRNVVYEIGKLTSPVGIVLVDTTDIKTTVFFKNPRDAFLEELTTVFGDAKRISEFNLKGAVHRHIETTRFKDPVVIEPEVKQLVKEEERDALLKRLRQAGLKRIAIVCLTYGLDGLVFANRLAIHMGFCDGKAPTDGIDMFAIIDEDGQESRIRINYGSDFAL